MATFCPDTSCNILVNSKCVYYEGVALPVTGINTNDSLQIALQKIETVIDNGGGGGNSIWGQITGTITNQTDLITYLNSNYYPSTNPNNYISRSGISGGTGINYNSGTGVITNSAPDQTVILTPGSGISISGTYPNFTITNTSSGSGGTVTSVNVSGGTTGLFFSGGPITTSGTVTMVGSLIVAHGGTGLTSLGTAFQVLRVNSGATGLEYATIGGVSGLTTNRIPYATSSVTLGDDSGLTWDAANNIITAGYARMSTYSPSYSTGQSNLFIGELSGNITLTSSLVNTGIGTYSLQSLTTGSNNTALGAQSGQSISSGFNNTALGSETLISLTTGSYSTALGTYSLRVTTGSRNTGLGAGTGQVLTTGADNTLVGAFAGNNLTTGSSNVVIGANIDAPSATVSGQLSIQNIIFGTGNTATGTTVSSGNIGIGIAAPSAKLHLAAGTASVPVLKFASGITLTAAQTGAFEYNGTNIFFTPASIREYILTTPAVNNVTPTSPNRTITINIGGINYYIHAKTTND